MSPKRTLLSLLLVTSTLASSGCGRHSGALVQLAKVAAVVAVRTAVMVAASRSESRRSRYASTALMPSTREVEGCGRCPEPDNGYALCFVSTCEARCIEGYVLEGDRCVPAP